MYISCILSLDCGKEQKKYQLKVPKCTQNASNLLEEIVEIAKIVSGIQKMRDRFFDDFWDNEKNFLGSHRDVAPIEPSDLGHPGVN